MRLAIAGSMFRHFGGFAGKQVVRVVVADRLRPSADSRYCVSERRTSSASSGRGRGPAPLHPARRRACRSTSSCFWICSLVAVGNCLITASAAAVGILARRVPAFEARRDEFPVQVGIGRDPVVARDDRRPTVGTPTSRYKMSTHLEAAIAHLHRLEIGAAEDGVDLLLEQRADERAGIDVDRVELGRVDIVGRQDRIEQRRLRRAGLDRDPLADEVRRACGCCCPRAR